MNIQTSHTYFNKVKFIVDIVNHSYLIFQKIELKILYGRTLDLSSIIMSY